MPLNKEQLEELQTFDTPPQSLRLQGGEVHSLLKNMLKSFSFPNIPSNIFLNIITPNF
jgi:hypothetical protein